MSEETKIEERVAALEAMEVEELYELVVSLEEQVETLQEKINSMPNGNGRKQQVHDALVEHGPVTIIALSELLGISTKNVSSQLTYLRQEGINICTDVNGKKFILD